MKRIALEGAIGWEVTAAGVRKALDEANGDDIDLLVNSPGGIVTEGFAVFNAIRDYRRAGGKVFARVVGLGASMSSYIPMAADRVAVEDNAVWMIHNPWTIALGNQNELRAEAEILDGLAGLIASAYEKKTGKSRAAVRAMMDSETWLFGADIKAAGFADELVPAGEGAENKDEALAYGRSAFRAMTERLRREADKQPGLGEIAAMLPVGETTFEIKPGVAGKAAADQAAHIHEEGQVMTLDQLKKELPEVYAAAKTEIEAAAEARGVQKERDRVAALEAWGDPVCAKIVAEARASGKSVGDVMPQLMAAMREARSETPPPVKPAGPKNGAGADGVETEVDEAAVIKRVRAMVRGEAV